jgi:hypothetical protein
VPSEIFTGRDLTEIELSSYSSLTAKKLSSILPADPDLKDDAVNHPVVDIDVAVETNPTAVTLRTEDITQAEVSAYPLSSMKALKAIQQKKIELVVTDETQNSAPHQPSNIIIIDAKRDEDEKSSYSTVPSSPVDGTTALKPVDSTGVTETSRPAVGKSELPLSTPKSHVNQAQDGALSRPDGSNPESETPVRHTARCDGCGVRLFNPYRFDRRLAYTCMFRWILSQELDTNASTLNAQTTTYAQPAT